MRGWRNPYRTGGYAGRGQRTAGGQGGGRRNLPSPAAMGLRPADLAPVAPEREYPDAGTSPAADHADQRCPVEQARAVIAARPRDGWPASRPSGASPPWLRFRSIEARDQITVLPGFRLAGRCRTGWFTGPHRLLEAGPDGRVRTVINAGPRRMKPTRLILIPSPEVSLPCSDRGRRRARTRPARAARPTGRSRCERSPVPGRCDDPLARSAGRRPGVQQSRPWMLRIAESGFDWLRPWAL
jgi:hypothetical protein